MKAFNRFRIIILYIISYYRAFKIIRVNCFRAHGLINIYKNLNKSYKEYSRPKIKIFKKKRKRFIDRIFLKLKIKIKYIKKVILKYKIIKWSYIFIFNKYFENLYMDLRLSILNINCFFCKKSIFDKLNILIKKQFNINNLKLKLKKKKIKAKQLFLNRYIYLFIFNYIHIFRILKKQFTIYKIDKFLTKFRQKLRKVVFYIIRKSIKYISWGCRTFKLKFWEIQFMLTNPIFKLRHKIYFKYILKFYEKFFNKLYVYFMLIWMYKQFLYREPFCRKKYDEWNWLVLKYDRKEYWKNKIKRKTRLICLITLFVLLVFIPGVLWIKFKDLIRYLIPKVRRLIKALKKFIKRIKDLFK